MSVALTDLDMRPDGSALRLRFGIHGFTDTEHFGKALIATSNLYQEHYKQRLAVYLGKEEADSIQSPRLMISRVRNGSISAWFTAVVIQGKFYLDQAKSLLDFGKLLKWSFDFFSGKSRSKPDLTLSQLEGLLTLALPIAAANDGEFVIEASEGDKKLRAKYSPTDCQQASSRIRNEVASRKLLTTQTPAERQLFYWYRATNDAKVQTGDRGKIDTISDRAVKVVFRDEETKRRMLEGALFEKSYLIEVKVHWRGATPQFYEIVNLIDIVDEAS